MTDYDDQQLRCAGRMASMTHDDFVQPIESYDGKWTSSLGGDEDPSLLVVGQQDWPLIRDGTLTPKLREARIAKERHHSRLTVLSEEQCLDGLGLGDERESVHRLYTMAVLTQLLQVSRERIRAWVKAGLITPAQTKGGVWQFDLREFRLQKRFGNLRVAVSQPRDCARVWSNYEQPIDLQIP